MIRLLTSQDTVSYKSLRLKALQTDPDVYQSTYAIESVQPLSFFSQTLQQAIIPPIFGYYGFFSDDTLAGYIQLEYQHSPKKSHTARLVNLYVDPDFRGQKIAQQLFDHLTVLAQTHGLEQLSLSCNATNVPAMKLYARQGFQEYGRKKKALKWHGHYDDIVMMQKEL